MQHMDTFRFLLGLLVSFMMIYFLVGLFPVAARMQYHLERRLKWGGATIIPISGLRRMVAALMFAMFAAELFAEAFHRDLSTLSGISPSIIHSITFMVLPPLVILLGIRDQKRFNRTHRQAIQ